MDSKSYFSKKKKLLISKIVNLKSKLKKLYQERNHVKQKLVEDENSDIINNTY